MKFLVCDDHAVFRDGLRLVLDELDGAAELLEAGSLEQALALAGAHPELELALLDLQLPGVDGLDGLRRLRAAFPTLPVVVVSAAGDPAVMRGALDAGASGFVPKALGRGELLGAFRLVLAGGVFVPQAALAPAASESATQRRARRRERAAGLTERQIEVLALLARGLTNKEIGEVLAIAENTVKVHVKAILETLEATNRTEAAVLARELDLRAPGEE